MLDGGVMSGLVNALGDAVALLSTFLILIDIIGRDHLRGVAGSGRGDGEIVRILEIVFQPDNRFGSNRSVDRLGSHEERTNIGVYLTRSGGALQ